MRTRVVRRDRGEPPRYEIEPAPDTALVGTYDFGAAIGDVLPSYAHSHDFFALVYLDAGVATVLVDGGEVRLGAGDLLLIAPGAVVDLHRALTARPTARGWGLAFAAEALGIAQRGSAVAWRAHPLLSVFATPRLVNMPPTDRPAWTQRLAALDREVGERRRGAAEAVAAHLTLVLVDLARRVPAAVVAGNLPTLIDEALAYLGAHFREPISLQAAARALHVSAGHLTTVVGEATGRTVHEWITHLRLIEARRLLAHSDLRVEEIGRRVGFRDPSYFARVFRRHHGMPPRTWRDAAPYAKR